MIRRAQWAGQFYPANPRALKKQLELLLDEKKEKEQTLGLVSPHAGYVFSGTVAASCFSKVKLTKSVIILGPNHTGIGLPFSVMSAGTWQMPAGNVEIDTLLAKKIVSESKNLQEDSQAHMHEHSIEVQVPFLQYFLPEVKIVPMVISGADFKTYDEIGQAIARVLKKAKRNCLIIASTDMTHYAPLTQAKANDNLAIEAILKLDGEELLKRVKRFNITMCGYGPVVCMLSSCKALGAKMAKLVKYQTSGQASGDYSQVVGYAGITIK